MRLVLPICLSIVTSAFLTGHVHAAGEAAGDLDVTIRVIDSKQGINELINRIELPQGAAEAAPASSTQAQKPASDVSEKDRETDGDTARKRSNTGKSRDERRDSGRHERNGNDQSEPQSDLSAPDRSWTSEHRPRDSADLPQRATDSRERRENMQSHSREQRVSTREKVRSSKD